MQIPRMRLRSRGWLSILIPAAFAAPLLVSAADLDTRGREILREMAEANRPWLVAPPEAVSHFSYTYHRVGKDPMPCAADDAQRVSGAVRQGATYYSLVHHVVRDRSNVQIRSLEEEGDTIRMSVGFDPPLRGHCGNGIRDSWYGYFNLGGDTGLLVLDARQMTPRRSVIGDVTETFADYVQIEPGRYAPLSIRIENGDDMQFDWSFAVHEPGLWLLDRSRYRELDVAWVDAVRINDADVEASHRLQANRERELREEEGHRGLQTFLDANRYWLLPSLEARRGLVYDYVQEDGYRERVIFDADGRVYVGLVAGRDEQEESLRRRLWLPDMQRVEARSNEPFVSVHEMPSHPAGLLQDRAVQHLAMGLGLDCGLTRLARDPDACWAEVMPGEDDSSNAYTLVLHWKGDARLFTGTMLMFTSWAYMHDVRYDRSEVLCDAATHRPLEETVFAGDKAVGRYRFEYESELPGREPVRIRAEVPHAKEGRDHSLDMTARFQRIEGDVWLLDSVESNFRGGAGGSTGRVEIVAGGPVAMQPVADLLDRLTATREALAAVEAAPEGRLDVVLSVDRTAAAELRPVWTETAREATGGRRDRDDTKTPLIGIVKAILAPGPEGGLRLALEGIADCQWQEYQTRWAASLTGPHGTLHEQSVELPVRSEGRPAAYSVALDFPDLRHEKDGEQFALSLEGEVRYRSGAYHGHGMWMRFAHPE